jgi:UDP-glucose 4-epimerase
MTGVQRILVTGAAGKVGQAFIGRLLASSDERFDGFTVRALCHNRILGTGPRLEVVTGSIEERAVADRAAAGVTHVVHLATSKETPETIIDVAVKGLFWLLEACRASGTFRQFILVGGDAGLGHFFYPHAVPVTEAQPHSAYPGCYALSKVLEEVMVEQYGSCTLSTTPRPVGRRSIYVWMSRLTTVNSATIWQSPAACPQSA